jgi:predicted Zn-dependent protease
MAGALIFGTLASIAGATDVEQATRIGATVGARTYSKEFELEADALGTVVAFRAGYDPARGADFFSRIPDPGNRFLGSHPPNAERRVTVQRTLATLR